MPRTDSHRGRGHAYIAGCLVAAVVAAVGGVVLLTGGDDKPNTAPSPPRAQTTSSPTPVPVVRTPPKPADVAAAAAKATYIDYLRVDDQVAQGGFKNLKPYDAVAISPERTELVVVARRSAGERRVGANKIYSLGVQKVSLAGDTKIYSKVELLACLDVTGTDVVNAQGRSLVSPKRLPRVKVNVVVQQIQAAAFTGSGRKAGWYVSNVDYPGGGVAC